MAPGSGTSIVASNAYDYVVVDELEEQRDKRRRQRREE